MLHATIKLVSPFTFRTEEETEEDTVRILDFPTGSCIWAMEAAEEEGVVQSKNGVEVVGYRDPELHPPLIDLPQNLCLKANQNDIWGNGQYDFIHSRVIERMDDWLAFVTNVKTHLRQKGEVKMEIISMLPQSDNQTLKESSPLLLLFRSLYGKREAATECEEVKRLLKAIGLQVQLDRRMIPIGTGLNGNRFTNKLGNYFAHTMVQFLNANVEAKRMAGVPLDPLTVKKAKREMEDPGIHAYCEWQRFEDETYFSSNDTDGGIVGNDDEEIHLPSGEPGDTSVSTGELLDVLSRHFRYWEFSEVKSGRLIICDRTSKFSSCGFEVCQGSVPTPHHDGDSWPNTKGCPYAPRQTCHDCEIDVCFKDYKYGEDPGVRPSEDVLLSITGATIPLSLFTKLSSVLEPNATIDVTITEANVEKVKKLMEEVGFAAKVLGEFSIPIGSRMAQELETGDLYPGDDLTREDDRGIREKLLDWAAGGMMSLSRELAYSSFEKRTNAKAESTVCDDHKGPDTSRSNAIHMRPPRQSRVSIGRILSVDSAMPLRKLVIGFRSGNEDSPAQLLTTLFSCRKHSPFAMSCLLDIYPNVDPDAFDEIENADPHNIHSMLIQRPPLSRSVESKNEDETPGNQSNDGPSQTRPLVGRESSTSYGNEHLLHSPHEITTPHMSPKKMPGTALASLPNDHPISVTPISSPEQENFQDAPCPGNKSHTTIIRKFSPSQTSVARTASENPKGAISDKEDSCLRSCLPSEPNSTSGGPLKTSSYADKVLKDFIDGSSPIADDEDTDYVEESAIDDEDDSSDWEDEACERLQPSMDEKITFQRVDSKVDLTSRRSLITLMIDHQNEGSRAGNVPSQSTSALPPTRTSHLVSPPLAVSPNDIDDAPLMMKRGKRSSSLNPITEVPQSAAQPITATASHSHLQALCPRTTRRNMLATELTESLKRNLLWERQQKSSTANAVLKRRHTSTDVSNLKQCPEKVYTKKYEDVANALQYFYEYNPGNYHSKGW
ncbi:DUF1752 domain containing protein [Colletotrichum camelliae]|nr:DUF1752 domain containing protein [Colletotrichum camelliae]